MIDWRSISKAPPKVSERPIAEYSNSQSQGLQQTIEGRQFDYRGGRILMNGQDLAQHLKDHLSTLGTPYWTQVASSLGQYRNWATRNLQDPEVLTQFLSMIQVFIAKIYGRINKKFDETVDGISFYMEDGQLVLNGINVHACIVMGRERKSKKVHVFLRGIRKRLDYLRQRSGANRYGSIAEVVEELIHEIDAILSIPPDDEIIQLPAPQVGALEG